MKTVIEATRSGDLIEPKHEIEIYCPNCSRDVDSQELEAKKCNDCGFDLSSPKQCVSIHVTTMPAAGGGVM